DVPLFDVENTPMKKLVAIERPPGRPRGRARAAGEWSVHRLSAHSLGCLVVAAHPRQRGRHVSLAGLVVVAILIPIDTSVRGWFGSTVLCASPRRCRDCRSHADLPCPAGYRATGAAQGGTSRPRSAMAPAPPVPRWWQALLAPGLRCNAR